MAGVTAQGFVSQTFGEIRDSLRAGYRTVFGNAVNVDSRSRNGQLIELFADALAATWELGEALSSAFDPNAAVGVLLDNLSALTGTFRRAAFPSSVVVTVSGTNGTVLGAGRRLKVNGTTALFESTGSATITTATPWSAGAIAVGQVVSSDGAIWQATTFGASSIAPSGAGPEYVEGTLRWHRVGSGLGAAFVDFESVDDGPVQAYSGTLSVIDTPVAGWNAAWNRLDAAPGALAETDAELRLRRRNEIAGIGSTPLDAARAYLLRKVPGITTCTVFENTTDSTVDGIAPHSVEALIEGGDDQAIFDALGLAATAAGIATSGNQSGSTTDSAGNSHAVKFSRPVEVDIYAKLFVTVDATAFPGDGALQIAEQIVEWGDARGIGLDAVASAVGAQAFKVPGVLDVPTVYIRNAPNPVASTTIAISPRERASYDTSRIQVVVSFGTP